jgi:ATP-dependent DNA helicase RecQ
MLSLRPFQKQALKALRPKPSHVLCVAPTGSGKSLIYERQARRPGTKTLLVTPLIALARQQLEQLRASGVAVSAATGRMCSPGDPPDPREQSSAWIVSPESLLSPARKRQLTDWQPNFLVVDECHCLWEWGEDFRPAFHVLPELLRSGSISRSLWLTATLPEPARHSLRAALSDLNLSLKELGSFSLPGQLRLEIERVQWSERSLRLLGKIEELKNLGCGLIFTQTRESCERLTRFISSAGVSVLAYHAGLSLEERRNAEKTVRAQNVQLVVATSAFGMGMDYSHLRWVLLWQAPPSLLALAQAIGRAGRSSDYPARAIVFWDFEDFQLIDWMAQGSEQRKKNLEAVADFLAAPSCRSAALEKYFNGQSSSASCGHCDYCASI